MSERQKKLTITRRKIFGAAAITVGAGADGSSTHKLRAEGSAWLSMDMSARRLLAEWAHLESEAMQRWDWYQLTETERAATMAGAEMIRIDEELAHLFPCLDETLARIKHLKARDLSGAVMKLAVASRLLDQQDSAASSLLADALATLIELYPSAAPSPVTLRL